MNEEINNLIDKSIEENHFINNGKGIIIKQRYIDVLKKYDIDVNRYSKISDIIFLIDNILNTSDDLEIDEYEELDNIVNELQEIQYYNNTNK